jgi:small-conductance mechanosensitive channel
MGLNFMPTKMKGQGRGGLANVLVITAVALIIGIFVFATISTNLDQSSLSAQANTSITNVSNNTFTAFTLAAVVLIVIAAAAIIRNLGLFG